MMRSTKVLLFISLLTLGAACEDDVLNAYAADAGAPLVDGSIMTADGAAASDGGTSADSGASGSIDAGLIDVSGSTSTDSGTPPLADAGSQAGLDTGDPEADDAGTPNPRDAGNPAADDAGTPSPRDAGAANADANEAPQDAGVNPGGVCGDGVLRDDRNVDDPDFEECDDGNVRAGDGCSPRCRLEGLPPLDCVVVPGRDRRTSFCRGRRSFPDAQRACRLQSVFVGTVATVISAQDNEILANILRRNQEGRGWIGLNDQRSEGRLVWDGRPARYVRFGGRGSRNTATDDCTFLRLDNENWQMGNCADANPFVCEEHPL